MEDAEWVSGGSLGAPRGANRRRNETIGKEKKKIYIYIWMEPLVCIGRKRHGCIAPVDVPHFFANDTLLQQQRDSLFLCTLCNCPSFDIELLAAGNTEFSISLQKSNKVLEK
jgi:hypothetical protein